jgi:hypothetical protein
MVRQIQGPWEISDKMVMGTLGLYRVMRAGGPPHRVLNLCVAALWVLPVLAGCSSSPSPTQATTPPAVVGTGYGSAAAVISSPSPSDGSEPSGLLVYLFGAKPAPPPAAAAASPPSTSASNAQTAVAPPPSSTPTTTALPAVVGTGYGSAAAVISSPSPSVGSEPSGLLVDLFDPKPAATPAAAAASPPSTSTSNAQTAVAPPSSSTPTTWALPAVVGTGYGSAAAVISAPSPSDGSEPSGLLVSLFGSQPAPDADGRCISRCRASTSTAKFTAVITARTAAPWQPARLTVGRPITSIYFISTASTVGK